MISIECFDYAIPDASGPDLRVTFELFIDEPSAWSRLAELADYEGAANFRIPPGDEATDFDEGDYSTRVWRVSRHLHPGVS